MESTNDTSLLPESNYKYPKYDIISAAYDKLNEIRPKYFRQNSSDVERTIKRSINILIREIVKEMNLCSKDPDGISSVFNHKKFQLCTAITKLCRKSKDKLKNKKIAIIFILELLFKYIEEKNDKYLDIQEWYLYWTNSSMLHKRKLHSIIENLESIIHTDELKNILNYVTYLIDLDETIFDKEDSSIMI